MTLYGLGRRGVAIHLPEQGDPALDSPIGLKRNEAGIQSYIDTRERERGISSLHVITYSLEDD